MKDQLNPRDFVITRKRKKYRFALFANNPLCFEVHEWAKSTSVDTLELGAGTGLFSVGLAHELPDQNILAVDVKADRLQKGARKASEAGLKNIRFLRAHADQLLETLPAHSVKTIWLTFPDPFPKKRSAKHRLTHPTFLAIYQQLLQPGGELYFKTDAKTLFDWSLEQLVREGWVVKELTFDLHNSDLPPDYKIQTTYETRFLRQGLPIYCLRASAPDIRLK